VTGKIFLTVLGNNLIIQANQTTTLGEILQIKQTGVPAEPTLGEEAAVVTLLVNLMNGEQVVLAVLGPPIRHLP
jgi:hypothetical protein